MHHTPAIYGSGGLDTDGYGQTTIDNTSSLMQSAESNNNNNCSFFNGQTNVITDGWTVSYTNGLNPMKQMEGKEKRNTSFAYIPESFHNLKGSYEILTDWFSEYSMAIREIYVVVG